MEPKKIKKLEIKKEVIANLDAPAMSELKGGAITDYFLTCGGFGCTDTCKDCPTGEATGYIICLCDATKVCG